MKRNELKWQNTIVQCYKNCGGVAAKWASEWLSGPPDLVASLPGIGMHGMEVKHVPTWAGGPILNPMTPLQRDWSRRYIQAGGLMLLGIVFGGTNATTKSRLFLTDPLQEKVHTHGVTLSYMMGKGFNMLEGVTACQQLMK